MPKARDLNEAFVHKIKALYDIENQLEKALPKMAKAATARDLKEGFKMHLQETKGHIRRLEEVFKMLEVKPTKLKSEGIRGIVTDGDWVAKEVDAPENIRDAMLAGAARYAEHYEMAGYMSAIEMARLLGMKGAVSLLQETLREEEATDKKLATAMKERGRA